ncbi:MAG: antitoxin Xre-like helix-turn-helix domain-containing protein [Candidatus Caenarcaniphilales bacterium]|nr:antitoxin Xre-like helix-turn-helix domain-containing protein [Candidatus Caenarcaniphilales bacterium]
MVSKEKANKLSNQQIEEIKNPDFQKLTLPALRTFFRIAEKWKLTNEEQMALLGLSASSTFFKWKNLENPKLDKDKFDRLSYVFRIYKSLQILFSNPKNADNWLKNPNDHPMFTGKPPLERIVKGGIIELYKVANHLDALRGIW